MFIIGDALKYLMYFLIGGTILTLVTYLGSKDRGLLAAFIAMFPLISAISILTIYAETGTLPVLGFVKGLLIFTPTWIIFLFTIAFLLPKQGILVAMAAGVSIYIVSAIILFYYFHTF